MVEVWADSMEAYEAALTEILQHVAMSNSRRPQFVQANTDGEDIEVQMFFGPAHIVRIRRITGYLSDSVNWQNSKAKELEDRVTHAKAGAI